MAQAHHQKLNSLINALNTMVTTIRMKLRAYKNHLQANGESLQLFKEAEIVANSEIRYEEDILHKTETICKLYEIVHQLPNADLEDGYESN